jgi:hypothetical protein
MNPLKFALKRLLLSMNLDVRKIGGSPASLRRFADADPITFQYLSDMKIAPSIPVDLLHTRAGIMAFPHHPANAHPFARAFQAARNAADKADREAAARCVLSAYYSMVQPVSALAVVDLQPQEAPGLIGIPLQNWVMPWSELGIEETAAHRRICLEEEGLARGVIVTMKDGANMFGPVSEKKMSLETARVASLAERIGANGFQPNPAHPIEVMGLRTAAGYRWLVMQGHHRLAACAAFDILKVPARIVKIIRREDEEFWPHVVSKTFTVAGAIKCFDRLYAGRAPDCAAPWVAASRQPEKIARETADAG